jgi:carboxyl-terminal processing protease
MPPLAQFLLYFRYKKFMNTVTFMKRNYKILLVVLGLSVTLFAFKMNECKDNRSRKDKLLLELLTFVIERTLQSLDD